MKNSFTISVDKPCSADWNSFTSTSTGGFCPLCEKNVVDFTRMSDDELVTYFKNASGATCGKFRASQLQKTHSAKRVLPSRLAWASAGLLSFMVFVGITNLQAQEIPVQQSVAITSENNFPSMTQSELGSSIRGIVRDEYGDPLPGVNIWLKGTQIGTVSDIEGRFEFPRELEEGDVLIFSFIGFVPEEYKVKGTADEVLEIDLEMTADITGEVIVGGAFTSQSTFGRLWSKVTGIFR